MLGVACRPGQEMVEALLASLRFSVFPDVPRALEELRGLGVRLVVVSNWDVSAARGARGTESAQLAGGVVTSAEVGSRKPDRRCLSAGWRSLGLAPSAVHVGDSSAEDVPGPRRRESRRCWSAADADPPGLRIRSPRMSGAFWSFPV